jgi:NDP-sugar pyrophosphorylase family protein
LKTQQRGFYGTIGPETVIKSCRIIKDTAVGSSAYIKGANKLKNITILSSKEEAAQIGEGVELINGIVGYGCRVFYGAKAVRFVLGSQCSLKYGARLIHSVLGDNSTVSCCEILNNLVFPVHEQHHNNSFLIAGLIEGMSNIAAGATLGSNHNSRANDGEIRALKRITLPQIRRKRSSKP